jgi:DNA-binding transcriptional MerR regulator
MAIGTDDEQVGIRAVSGLTGLPMDTLRWYEREGLLPAVDRSPDGRRLYSARSVSFVRLVQALRRTGMPVADVRCFVQLMGEGAASHGRRMAILEQQAAQIVGQIAQLHEDLATVQAKTAHYRDLIEQGLDCDGDPVGPATQTLQRQGASR